MGNLKARLAALEKKHPRAPEAPTLEQLGIIDDLDNETEENDHETQKPDC